MKSSKFKASLFYWEIKTLYGLRPRETTSFQEYKFTASILISRSIKTTKS